MAVSLSGKRSCTNPRRCQGLVQALDSRVTDVRQNPGAPRSSCWTARANAHDKCSSCPLLDIISPPLVPFRFLSFRPYVSLPVAKMPQPGTNTKHHAIRRTRRRNPRRVCPYCLSRCLAPCHLKLFDLQPSQTTGGAPSPPKFGRTMCSLTIFEIRGLVHRRTGLSS